MVSFARIDFASLAVEGLSSAAAGGLQEYMWRPTRNMGYIATGAALLGGVALKVMSNNPMLNQVGNAVFLSGAAVAGLKFSERYLSGGPVAARLPSGNFNRANSYVPARAMSPGYARTSIPASAMSRSPHVSVSTVNPGTGEQILSSRV